MAAHSRIQKHVSSISRPATSLEGYEEEEPGVAQMIGKRKGRIPLSSCPNPPDFHDTLHSPKVRGRSTRHCSMTSLKTKLNVLSLKSNSIYSTPKVESDFPTTPSHIPKLVPQVVLPAETPSPSKSPKKTLRTLPLYLNRTSNEVIAWDYDSRFKEVENTLSQFKEKMDSATTESKSLKEITEVYKIRSTSSSVVLVSMSPKSDECSHGTGDY